MDTVTDWLNHTNLVSSFCTQNGWVDSDSLSYEIQHRDDRRMRINIRFTEIVMEGSGCVADRVECFGQIEIEVDAGGAIVAARVL